MTGPRFIDTNILLYSISRDPAEASKRDIAIALLDAENIALSVQVLQEFYVQAGRACPRNRGRTGAYLAPLQGAGNYATRHDQRTGDQDRTRAVLLGRGYCSCRSCARLPRVALRRYEPWARGRRCNHQ